ERADSAVPSRVQRQGCAFGHDLRGQGLQRADARSSRLRLRAGDAQTICAAAVSRDRHTLTRRRAQQPSVDDCNARNADGEMWKVTAESVRIPRLQTVALGGLHPQLPRCARPPGLEAAPASRCEQQANLVAGTMSGEDFDETGNSWNRRSKTPVAYFFVVLLK